MLHLCLPQGLRSTPLTPFLFAILLAAAVPTAAGEAGSPATAPPVQRFDRYPLTFEVNRGQAAAAVRFLSRGRQHTLLLGPDEATISLRPHIREKKTGLSHSPNRRPAATVRMRLAGANQKAPMEGIDPLPATASYFLGSDPSLWRTGIPSFSRVVSKEVYPGIDQIYYGNEGELEFDFRVAPGADPRKIRLSYSGMQSLRIDEAGDLVLTIAAGEIRQHKPRMYQPVDGSARKIAGRYRLYGGNQAGFTIDSYNPALPLVIDPVMTYATYLGGGASDEAGSVAVDASGNVYMVGTTESLDFPAAAGSLKTLNTGECDAFVSKFTSAGNLAYSTYLGGRTCEFGMALAVDTAGSAYVTGVTESADFPLVNAFQPSNRGGLNGLDAFVAKLDPMGSQLVYSTYLGGTLDDYGLAIAVDNSGNAYVAGITASNNFPVIPSSFQGTRLGLVAGFVTKLSANGQTLVYSTYMGGSLGDAVTAIAVDSSGHAYVTGESQSSDFPTSAAAYQRGNRGATDAFALKLNPSGSAPVWATLLGGAAAETGLAIAVDASGNTHVAGITLSPNFPTTPNAFQTALGGGQDGFLATISPDGQSLVYATYYGGSEDDSAISVGVSTTGQAILAGVTESSDLPTAKPLQAALRGYSNCFLATVSTSDGKLEQATYYGGTNYDDYCVAAAGRDGSVYLAGTSDSVDLPLSKDAFQKSHAAGRSNDAFLARFDLSPAAAGLTFTPAAIRFEGAVGTPLPPRNLSLTAAPGAGVSWTIDLAGSVWFSVNQASGTGSAMVEVSALTSGLSPGDYSAVIRVSNQASGALMALIPLELDLSRLGTSVAAASYAPGEPLAAESIASMFGEGLASGTASAGSLPLPDSLANVSIRIRDSAGTERRAPLFFVSPKQINYLVPNGTATGPAAVTVDLYSVYSGILTMARGTIEVAAVAPGIFTANQSGKGVPAAEAIRVAQGGAQTTLAVVTPACAAPNCAPVPIDLGGETDQVVLVLYGTGIRGRSALSAVTARIGGTDAPVDYAGPQGQWTGLDQVNIRIPRSLMGRGNVDVVLTVDGKPANTVTISIK